jgi:cell wall-associated NlpC family hydrolase
MIHYITKPVTDLRHTLDGGRDTQLLYGDAFDVQNMDNGLAFGISLRDGYVGYVNAGHLHHGPAPTHWVTAQGTHLYTRPDFKAPEHITLSHSSRLCVTGVAGKMYETPAGFVPIQHLAPLSQPAQDPAAITQSFVGVPYLWGGNSRWGMDCSGLVLLSLTACALPCPRDSGPQRSLGQAIPENAPRKRGDLVFWKGHVGMMLDAEHLIHANAHHMAVAIEPLTQAETRIKANEFGPIEAIRRL